MLSTLSRIYRKSLLYHKYQWNQVATQALDIKRELYI